MSDKAMNQKVEALPREGVLHHPALQPLSQLYPQISLCHDHPPLGLPPEVLLGAETTMPAGHTRHLLGTAANLYLRKDHNHHRPDTNCPTQRRSAGEPRFPLQNLMTLEAEETMEVAQENARLVVVPEENSKRSVPLCEEEERKAEAPKGTEGEDCQMVVDKRMLGCSLAIEMAGALPVMMQSIPEALLAREA